MMTLQECPSFASFPGLLASWLWLVLSSCSPSVSWVVDVRHVRLQQHQDLRAKDLYTLSPGTLCTLSL